MGVREKERFLEQWRMDARDLHRRLIPAPAPRSGPFGKLRRWHAIWLLAQGWTASGTVQAQGRDPHTIGRWAAAFGEGGPAALMFEQPGGLPTLCETQQAELKAAVQELPAMTGIELADWTLRQAQEEVGPPVCPGAIQPEPQRLPELSAPVGVRLEASQEAAGQG